MKPTRTLLTSLGILPLFLLPLCLLGIAALAAAPRAGLAAQEGANELEEHMAKIRKDGDRVSTEVVQQLANLRTREALDALFNAYDLFQTVFMKREVVRMLRVYDGVTDCEQKAMQRLMDEATASEEREIRAAAVDSLAQCRTSGKPFLKLIVTSPADDAVRETALEAHIALGTKDDHAWYGELWKPKKDQPQEEKPKPKPKPKKPKKGEAEPEAEVEKRSGVILNSMRLMAFDALVQDLKIDELVETATKDEYARLRKAALEELARRGEKKTLDIAWDVVKSDGEQPENRVVAARIVAAIEGDKCAKEFIKRATAFATPVELRRGLAEILIGFNDEDVNKELLKDLGRGKAWEKLFHMYAVRSLKDERVDKALLAMLKDKEPEVVISSATILGERGTQAAADDLKALFEHSKDRGIRRASLDALARLRSGQKEWVEELVALTKHADPEVRNLALSQLGATTDKTQIAPLVAALADKEWSTRLAALEALERVRDKEAVSAIVAQMGKEEGRMRVEFARALWRLTGQPFEEDAKAWQNWWGNSKEAFQLLSGADLEKVKSGEEEWRLRQTTRVKSEFFGIRIISHRVIFIVDVSGSMEEKLTNDYKGKSDWTRMEVAKSELEKCLKGLDPAAFFNIVVFSSGVERWQEGALAPCDDQHRQDALDFVGKLGAGGGTNLYDSLENAFEDKDVDTIFVLSDGEPSVGKELEPLVIREHVARWNENRGVVIHTVAVGGQFRILEWLAEDSGGTHVKFE